MVKKSKSESARPAPPADGTSQQAPITSQHVPPKAQLLLPTLLSPKPLTKVATAHKEGEDNKELWLIQVPRDVSLCHMLPWGKGAVLLLCTLFVHAEIIPDATTRSPQWFLCCMQAGDY